MICFFDVDAIHKLAGYNALDESLILLGATHAEVRVLPTTRFKLRLKKPDEAVKRHGAETAERLMAFIAAVEEAGEALTDAEAQRLAQVPGVDAGELVLIPLAARETTGFFVTGDKNALRAGDGTSLCTLRHPIGGPRRLARSASRSAPLQARVRLASCTR